MVQAKFEPRDNQIDYTNIRYCPVINCVLRYKDKILLVKRSADMRLYPSYWNGVSGFLDDHKGVEERVYEELSEEPGLKRSEVKSITRGSILVQESEEYKKTWLIFPILVDVKTDKVTLDWEAAEHRWMNINETKKLKLLAGFDQVLAELFGNDQRS